MSVSLQFGCSSHIQDAGGGWRKSLGFSQILSPLSFWNCFICFSCFCSDGSPRWEFTIYSIKFQFIYLLPGTLPEISIRGELRAKGKQLMDETMCVCSQVILDTSQKTTFLHNFSPSVPHAWPYQAWSNFAREDAESPWQLCIRRKKDKTQAFILIRLFSGEANLYKSPGFGSDNVDSQRAQLQVLGSVQGKGLGLTRAVKCLCLSCRLGLIMALCCALIPDYLIFFFSLMPVMPTLYFPLWIWTRR